MLGRMVELVIIIGLRINMFSSPTFLRVKLLILNTVIIQVIIELGGMLFGVSGLLLLLLLIESLPCMTWTA